MWRAICTHIIKDDFKLLLVGNQIDTLIPNPSFDHNLCWRHSNESYKPILSIFVSRNF
jgi:hypothetical protein